jgi:vancomycin resistance protein YoaR
MRAKGMARSFSSRDLSSELPGGLSTPWSTLRDAFGGAFHRVRTSVLPEIEDDEIGREATAPGRSRSRVSTFLRRAVPTLMWAVLLLAVGLVVFRVAYADRVYPAVAVGDVPVGGLTMSQAEAKLTDRAEQLENGTFTFTYKGKVWTPSLSELGVSVMLDESLAEARHMGRGGNATSRLEFVGNILSSDQVVPLQTRVDEDVLNTWFDSVDRDIDNLPVNPSLKIEGTKVQVVPGSDGVMVDRKAATAEVMRALDTLEPMSGAIPTYVAHPDFTAADLAPAEKQVAEALSQPVPVTFEDESWKIKGEDLGAFVTADVVLEHGKPTAKLSIDTRGLAASLRERFSDDINRKPVDAVFGWDDGLVALEPGVYGAALRSDAFADAVGESFLNGHHEVKIPVVSIAPEVDDTKLESYGIVELLGGGHSNFAGGAASRDQNIYVATELLNHTLVAPGETFSFNRAIGEITADKGYEEASVVVAEQVGRDIGGGVCQVSTTVFRAALNSGMPIEEWHPHTYRLSNYERDGWGPGFDASILQYGPDPDEWADSHFENYTDHWILVESYASDAHVYVNIYGTSDGREVAIDAWPIGGNAFGFTRTIYDKGGEVVAERSFESHFK